MSTGVHPLDGSPDVLEVRVPVATMWTSPEAPRDVDAAAVRDTPDLDRWSAGVVTTDLVGLTLTQLLLGEAVHVLEDRGEWVRAAALWQPNGHAAGAEPEGYVGWVRRAHLGAQVLRHQGASAFVLRPRSTCRTGDGTVPLSFGTGLWVDAVTDTEARVLLPGDRVGTVPLSDVRLAHKPQQPMYGPDDVLDVARQFLGLRYIWGGTSSWGLDCSGLVHLVHRALGVVLPRDASDQAACEEIDPVGVDEVEPGDLYFFARPDGRVTHVGFVTAPVGADGTRRMLHAPEGGGFVEEAAMAPGRRETLVAAGRVRKPDAGQFPRLVRASRG
jgi:cell wall-associated NlpC family hydrolase